MLRELSIKNFAIIDDLKISFSEGLTILSGETGAGKSILINAVNLLLGSRAFPGLIRTGEDTAELEALFEIKPESRVADILKEFGYDPSEDLIIRRIISQSERHRVYINGRMFTLSVLNAITENLAGISGQHSHQKLLKEDQHLLILDQFGQLMPLRENVSHIFHELLPLIRKINELKAGRDKQKERIEFLQFQKNEIMEAALIPGEDAALQQDLMRLKNGKKLHQTVYDIVGHLYSSPNAVIERMADIRKQLEKAGETDPVLSSKAKSIADILFQLEDLTNDLRKYIRNIEFDDRRIEEIEIRTHIIQKLKRKYGNGSLDGVFSNLESMTQELSSIEHMSDEIEGIEKQISGFYDELTKKSLELSAKRKQTAAILSRKVEEELATLKMSQTRFETSIIPIPATSSTDPYLVLNNKGISETGIDKAAFLIAPNIGESLKPLANIASGGELSRVVLALKSILSESESVSTIIFDEVDAGIGGGTAEVIGRKLASLASYHQIICITHLAQIARFGNHHFKISKQVAEGRTRTLIELLDKKNRVEEIARMIGGETITKATLDHAVEMLQKV